MIESIRMIKTESPYKYELKKGERILAHTRHENISGDIRTALRPYSEDAIFEVIAANREFLGLENYIVNTN